MDIALVDARGFCQIGQVVIAVDELDFDFFAATFVEGLHAGLELFDAVEVKAGVIE